MTSPNLPQIHHLPLWGRVGRLGKPSLPRGPPASHLLPLPVIPPGYRGEGTAEAEEEAGGSGHSGAADPRVSSLRRNIQFLQEQHRDTLDKLHAEIEHLRRQNKELHYRLIMDTPKSSKKGMQHSQRDVRPPTQGREAHAGLYLEQTLQDTQPLQDQTLSSVDASEPLGCTRKEHATEMKGGLITSLQPLRIHSSPSHPPRAPTLQECEVIIRQLYNANSIQSQEILRVKALLRDIVLSKKITPENYILTKAYLVDGTHKPFEEKKFPKLSLRSFPEKMSEPSVGSRFVLPALTQSLSSTIADRQRRTRAVQRDRLKRSLQ